MKSILISNRHARIFRARVKDEQACPSNTPRRVPGKFSIFHTTHAEPWRALSVCRTRRTSRVSMLKGE